MIRARRVSIFSMMVFLLCFMSLGYSQGIPQQINYNGILADVNGNPVPDGQYDVVFTIYDAMTNGNVLWTETWSSSTAKVVVANGNFNALLGAHNTIPSSFFTDHPTAYLGVKVGTDSEMLPRQKIVSVGYAFTAGNGIPRGGIIMWSGSFAQIPYGWGLCDGLEKTAPDGTKVTPPNLQDRFIVGAGSGYAVGATGGSGAINLTHAHTINTTDTNHQHWVNGAGDHTHGYEGRTGLPTGDTKRKGTDSLDVSNNDHQHDFSGSTHWGGLHDHGWTGTVNQNWSHSHSENSQLSGAQDIRPPYYALAFIMKL